MEKTAKISISLPEDAVEKYLAGYRAQPESAEETETVAAASLDALPHEPWE